uniref:catenin alpha-2-like n=1 Tax=Myxine glutinosa TaxID=7769 RepID=UPI00358DDF47
MTSHNNMQFKGDPNNLEIRTLSLERTLKPLVQEVTTLENLNKKGPSNKKKGRSKKAHVLSASVERATHNFIEKGDQIAQDSEFLKDELSEAVQDVRNQGESMREAAGKFADEPCSSMKRGAMVRTARALLSAVTRLLITADMADVMKLLQHLRIAEQSLEKVRLAGNQQELADSFKKFGQDMVILNQLSACRQQVPVCPGKKLPGITCVNFEISGFNNSLQFILAYMHALLCP